MQNQNLVGSDTNGVSVPVADYKQQQYGFSLGGPIIRDRLHFFVTGDFRHDNRPFPSSIQLGPTGDTTGVGITQARFDSVTSILADSFGINAGTWRAPQINNPETNLFGKLDLELGVNNHVELSGDLINVNQDKLIHLYRSGFTQPPSLSNARDGYELSGSGYYVKDQTRTVRGKWTANFGNRFANEFIVGRTTISDNRPPVSNYPLILVGDNSAGTYIAAGAERFSHANSLDQRVVELTDNVTFPVGRHLLTFGTHNEFIHFRNVFFPGSTCPRSPRPRSTPLSTRASPFRRSEAGAWTHARRRVATSCGHRGWGSTTTWAVARRRSCGAASGYSAAGRRTCGCRMPMATRASSNRPYSAMVRRRRRTTGHSWTLCRCSPWTRPPSRQRAGV